MNPHFEQGGVTVYHGDCLEVMPHLEIGAFDAVVCDPPYGVAYQSNWSKGGPRFDVLANDDAIPLGWVEPASRLAPVILAFCEWRHSELLRQALEDHGLRIRGQVVWDRMAHGMGDLAGGVAPQHDLAWLAAKSGWTFPGVRMKSVLRHSRGAALSHRHPTQKPISLMREVLSSLCPSGGLVLDPFLGSGSTALASAQLGLRCVGIECDSGYLDLAIERIKGALSDARTLPSGARQAALFDEGAAS